jgi:adenosylhomocysteine nucleosidase
MNSDRGPVAIVMALAEEADALVLRLPRSTTSAHAIKLHEGAIEGASVALAICGIGKVASAMATQLLCDTRKPRAVLSICVAGGTGDGERGRVIVASGAVQHDFDARPLAPGRGLIPGFGGPIFHADKALADALQKAARVMVEDAAAVQSGLVLSGDQIIASSSVRDGLLAEFPGAACFDMETAAVAQVAGSNGVAWGGLRVTSDAADETFESDEVLAFGAGAAAELFERIIRRLMKDMDR